MIRPALQLFASLTLRNAKIVSPAVSNILLRRPVIYNFCKDQDKHQEKHQEKQDKKHTEKQEQDKQKETQHNQHNKQHEVNKNQKEGQDQDASKKMKNKDEHVHGPHCKHGEKVHTDPTLTKMTFQQLLDINTEESLKLAQLRIKHLEDTQTANEEELKQLNKNIDFFMKLEEEIKEKEAKIKENILMYEQEAKLSKRRAEKEVQQSKDYAVTKIAKELLEVADCISSCRKYTDELLRENPNDQFGLKIKSCQQRMVVLLKKYDIEQFDPVGQEYDPNTQQSLLQIPCPPNYKVNSVGLTMRTGYKIKGRLLRSARVGVFN